MKVGLDDGDDGGGDGDRGKDSDNGDRVGDGGGV